MRARVRRLGYLLLLGLVAGSLSCSCGDPVQGVILITVDTTRADRIGCYGYTRGSTPSFDAMARDGVLFEQVLSPVPITLPSHATMFTGVYPPVHGVRYNGMFRLADSSVTVAELLKDAGWSTAGMPAAYPLTEDTGIGQGFELYRDLFQELPVEDLPASGERTADEITEIGLEWLRGRSGKPFFLWLHYFDPHTPYEPPFPFSAQYSDRPYDGEIAFMDREIGKLFEYLESEGLWDTSLVVVAGDHGEALWEHGEKMHANLAYQSTLAVPLIVRAPGGDRSARIVTPVSLVDIAPTILDYAGVQGPEMQGISLRPAVEGATLPPRTLYFESLGGSLSFGWSPLEGIRRGRWKYIRSVEPELFDLEEDPGEQVSLHHQEAIRVQDMESELASELADWQTREDTAEEIEIPIDPEEMERLASLGYVGGAVVESNRGGANPKDLIHLESAVHYARELQKDSKYDKAMEQWNLILEENPRNRHALHNAVIAAVHMSDFEAAFQRGDQMIGYWPDFIPGYITFGEAYGASGQFDKSAAVFRDGLEIKPGDDGLSYRLAVALLSGGRIEEAGALAERTLVEGGGAYYRLVLATCLAIDGKVQEAEKELTRTIEDGYERKEVLLEEPVLEPLRKLPGFDRIIAAIPDEEEETSSEAPGAPE